MNLYDFPCEYCDGVVRQRIVDREPVSHHRGIVVLENVPVGVCDRCGAHYYAAPVLKRVESILTSASPRRAPSRCRSTPFEPRYAGTPPSWARATNRRPPSGGPSWPSGRRDAAYGLAVNADEKTLVES